MREREHGDEHSDGAGDSKHGNNCRDPAGADTTQVIDNRNSHESNPPKRINHAQAHCRGSGKDARQNSYGEGDTDSKHDCRAREKEEWQEAVGGVATHAPKLRNADSDAAAYQGDQDRFAQDEEKDESVSKSNGF